MAELLCSGTARTPPIRAVFAMVLCIAQGRQKCPHVFDRRLDHAQPNAICVLIESLHSMAELVQLTLSSLIRSLLFAV
jgi:hypothetical protein